VHIGFWWGNLREGDHLKDPDMMRVYCNGSVLNVDCRVP
jgi:hypothetical protein